MKPVQCAAIVFAALLARAAWATPVTDVRRAGTPDPSKVKAAEKRGFSPSVAQRVAALRPDLLEVHPETKILAEIFTSYRGIHDISLAEFQPTHRARSTAATSTSTADGRTET